MFRPQENARTSLQRPRHFADFVEKQRPRLLLYLADLLLDRPGEGTLLMPEQLALEQRLRDGRAV